MTSKTEIRRWLKAGQKKGATHMLVVCDTFDWEDYPVYVMPHHDVQKTRERYERVSMQKVECYSFALDIEAQLGEHRKAVGMGAMPAALAALRRTNARAATPHDNEGDPMPETEDKPSLKHKAAGQAKALGGAVALGGKLVAVNKTGDILMRMAAKLGRRSPAIAALLEDEDGRELVKGLIALGLHSAGTYAPLPERMASAFCAVSELQLTASIFLTGNKYGDLFMEEIEELVQLGDSLKELPAPDKQLDEGEESPADVAKLKDRQSA